MNMRGETEVCFTFLITLIDSMYIGMWRAIEGIQDPELARRARKLPALLDAGLADKVTSLGL